jgi:hypothetical protein
MTFKIVERTFVREIDCSAAVVWWNHWDHEHVTVAHSGGWVDGAMLYEDEKYAIGVVTIRVPVFSFVTSQALNINIKHDAETMYTINLGLFGVPSVTRIHIHEDRRDHVVHTTTYKFLLRGWRRILAPFLPRLMTSWNERTWREDLPLKLRRQKVLRLGFRDFVGLPDRIEDRVNDADLVFRLPVPRFAESWVNDLRHLLD